MNKDSKELKAQDVGASTGLRKPWSAPRVIESRRAKHSAGGTSSGGFDGHVPTTTPAYS